MSDTTTRDRRRRIFPRRRGARTLVYLAMVLAYAALLWFVVFPWIDRTFVSKPTL